MGTEDGGMAGVRLDSTLEAGRRNKDVASTVGRVKGPEVQALPVRDPVDVLRAAFDERARWTAVFRKAGLGRQESDDLLHTMEDARGGQDHVVGRRQRALDHLVGGRGDWFESLLRHPAKLPEQVRTALADVAARSRR
jgi:hypothetical protein